MKMQTYIQLLFVGLASLLSLTCYGQIDTLQSMVGSKVTIETDEGYEIRGTLQSISDSSILLSTTFGSVTVREDQLKKVILDTYTGDYRFENPHTTRYFFGPSATQLRRGEGYYQNVLLVGNFVNVGITNHVSIGGGFEFLSLVTGNPIGFFTPKIGTQLSDKWGVGAGVLMIGAYDFFSAALPYGVVTYGTTESNVSLGVGVYSDFDEFFSESPVFLLSGTQRISNSLALLSENYFLYNASDESLYFGIHGIRVLSEKNAFDFGLFFIDELNDFVPLPFVGYARKF